MADLRSACYNMLATHLFSLSISQSDYKDEVFGCNFVIILTMSQWFATEKERQLQLLKQRHMHSILVYNLQSVEMKKAQRKEQIKRDTQHDAQNCQVLQLGERSEWERKQRRKREQRESLKAAYEQQLKVHQMQKEKELQEKIAYAQLEKEYIDYEENKRIQELTRHFQRPSFKVTPAQTHRRVLTEPNHSPEPHPSQTQLHLTPHIIKLIPVRMEPQQAAHQNRSISTPRLLTEPPSIPSQASPSHYHRPRRASLLPPIS